MLAGGTDTVEALSAACGAGSSCGACYPMLEDLLAEVRAGSDSLTAVHAAA
jgi:NAD(P)H-nitrite reductase large subunit